MDSKDKPMIAAKAARETDTATVRGEALQDGELDQVAGGGHRRPFTTTQSFICPKCKGVIPADPRFPHDCPAEQVPIRQ